MAEIVKATHHHVGVRPSTIPQIFWVIHVKLRSFSMIGRPEKVDLLSCSKRLPVCG
jgi:hypothetical protein